MRLRDFFDGKKGQPPKGSDLDDLMREIGEMDDVDPEEMARLCRRGQARVLERIEEIMREEGKRGE
jgi:HEPN domain-containing protein